MLLFIDIYLFHLSGVVKEISEDGFYTIGTKDGTIAGQFSRNQIAPCTTNFIDVQAVPENSISDRSASCKASIVGGQGIFRCKCTTKCVNNRCICRKNKPICNSKCHNALSCCNK